MRPDLLEIAGSDLRSRGEGLVFLHGRAPGPLGPCFFAECEGRGLFRFSFPPPGAPPGEEEVRLLWPRARLREDPARAARWAEAAFASAPTPGGLPLWLGGTPFQRAVWRALARVPPGCLATYRELALQAGRPRAWRAAGGAVGANPVAVFLPCHRVVRSSGALGGYRWGLDIKRELLRREEAARPARKAGQGRSYSKERLLDSCPVGKSSGIPSWETLPVAAHSVPRCRATMNPTHSME